MAKIEAMSYSEAVSDFEFAIKDFRGAANEVAPASKGIVSTIRFDSATALATVVINQGGTHTELTVKCTVDDFNQRRMREGSPVVLHGTDQDGLGVIQFPALPPTKKGGLSTIQQPDLLAAYSVHPGGKGIGAAEVLKIQRISQANLGETTLSGAVVLTDTRDKGYLIGADQIMPTDTVVLNTDRGIARIYSTPASHEPSAPKSSTQPLKVKAVAARGFS
jgi:hypothetical protein